MVEGLDEPMPAGPKDPSGGSRSPLLFALVVLFFAAGALLATLALAAVFSALGLWGAVGLGFLISLALPLFLVVRVRRALRRRGLKPAVRHLVALVLALMTHAALFGVSLEWADRSTGDLFFVAHSVVERTLGDVPLLSGILRRGAEEARITLGGMRAPGSGDGGTLDDAGAQERDAGALAQPTDAGPEAKQPSPLSPRTAQGREVAGVVSLLRTSLGGYGAMVTRVDAGGAVEQRALDLTPFSQEGGPTVAASAKDGAAAFVTGDGSVIFAGPSEKPRALPALARGTKLQTAQGPRVLRAVRDLAVAPGGAMLLIADLALAEGAVAGAEGSRALLAYHPSKPGPVEVLRQSGDAVPGAAEGSKVSSFALFRAGPAGRVAVIEGYLEGGEGAGEEQRLLAGRVAEPKLLVEIARSGDAIVGLPMRAVGRFLAASALADGRVLADVQFAEEAAGGTLIVGRSGASPVGLAAEAVLAGKAPWPLEAPRAEGLISEPDGRFSFMKAGGGLVIADVDRPLSATLLSPGVQVYRRQGDGVAPLGAASELSRPTLAQGGDWLLVGARLEDGRRALLSLARDDAAKGVAEALLVEGEPLPDPARAVGKPAPGSPKPASIRSLLLYDWHAGSTVGISP